MDLELTSSRAVFQECRSTGDVHDTNQHLASVGVGETEFLSENEVNRLGASLVDGDVSGVKVRSVEVVPDGIEPPCYTWDISGCLREDDRAPCGQVMELHC